MADLWTNTAELPKTVRGAMPYEVDALSVREIWGHGHGQTTVLCRQSWDYSATWLGYMLGVCEVKSRTTAAGASQPYLVRHIPEPLRYKGFGNDPRTQWCTGASQRDQGGNPPEDDGDPSSSTEPFTHLGTNWPRTAWIRYDMTFETTPFQVRTADEVIDLAAAAGDYAGSRELYQYMVRESRLYSKEQPLPAGIGGFKVIDDANAANRKPVGQSGFRVITMGDVVYKWVRVPAGWPPPPGWSAPEKPPLWPPAVNPGAVAPGTKRPTRDTYRGTINSTYFDCAAPEGYNWQPGELLYLGYEDYFYWDAVGQFVTDRTHRFKYKEGGWNYFLAADGTWKEVSLTGTSTGTKPYATNDFNNLFEYASA